MTFHHTKIVQRARPKPHLRLHVRFPGRTTFHPGTAVEWRVSRLVPHDRLVNTMVIAEITQTWPSSRLALDAAFYQFACEWPAGRR